MDPLYSYYLSKFIITFGQILNFAILARIVLSWVAISGRRINNPLSQFIFNLTNPILNFFKKLPHRIGMIDLSPIIAILAIDITQRVLLTILQSVSQ